MFTRVTLEQVNSFYQLVKLLRRLRAIGTLHCKTMPAVAVDIMDMNSPYAILDMSDNYEIVKEKYDPKRSVDAEELLEQIFGRISGPQYRGTP